MLHICFIRGLRNRRKTYKELYDGMEKNWVYVGLPVIEGPDYHVRLGLGRKEKASVLLRVWQSVGLRV